ncbi:MAG TPA: catecholate siderophore receptor Fiu [Rhodanobacteraceae bacterium]|nr:catecholate siderophore receptor Fiu [Rhodanobacteraceae bacterium]
MLASPKFTAPLIDTTQTIQVIGAELIEQQGAATLTQALRNSPGVGTFYVGENGTTSTGDAIRMRGFDTAGSIFVDGVRDLGSISRDVFNIAQIEVTKGPAGTDYGRTAPSGSINMVSKQPLMERHAAFDASYGSGDQRRITADINLPLSEAGGSALRLNIMGQDSGVPGRDVVHNDRWGVAPAIAFGLGSATRFYLDALHVRQDNVPDGGVSTVGLPGYISPDPLRPQIGTAPPADSSNFYGTNADHDDVTADMLTLRIEHDIGSSAMLRNTTRWGRTSQDYLLTSFMASSERLNTPDLSDPSTWAIARSNPTFKNQRNEIATNQFNLSVLFSTGSVDHALSAGLELTRETLDATGVDALNGSAWPDANLYQPNPHVRGLVWGETGAHASGTTDTAAAYLFDTMSFSDRWQLNVGARLDHYRTGFDSTVPCGERHTPACGDLPDGSIVPGLDGSVSGNLGNWKLGLLYKPAANASLYADLAVAQQPPGGASLELSNRARSEDNPIYDPQHARTAELGAKWSVGSGLLLTAAVYRTTVDNQVVQDPVDQLYYQVGRKRVQGIELGASGHITPVWELSAGYTRMDASVTRGAAVAEDGSADLAYTPDSAFTAWTAYTLPSHLTLGGGVRYAGGMKRGTDGAIGTPEFTRSWWVADAMASYPVSPNVTLQLNLYNLFDKEYVAAINKSGYRYTPGAPRSFLLSARVEF